jgi:MinD-like ATPase involved in chromosome partitioning or flagellar assembly
MNTCAVTIAGPDHRVDLVVSTETPIRELIPTFVELSVDEPGGTNGSGPPVWAVAPPGHQPLQPDRTLAEAGIADGAVLQLTEVRSAAMAPPSPAAVDRERAKPEPPPPSRGTPRDRTQRALPERLSQGQRISKAIGAFFGHEGEEPVFESMEPSEPTVRDQLTKAEHRGPMARYRESLRESDYESRLDRAIAAPRLQRCVTIAVVSPKGGVGKTTLTALLGSLLARVRRDRIVAIDTNPDYGSLGRTLAPEHTIYVDDLLETLDRPDLTVTALDDQLGRAFEGLMVLPAPTSPERMAALDEQAYGRVIARLKELVGVLVLDCGTGLQEPAARAAQAAADQIVLISDAHPSTASLVTESERLLSTGEAPITVVVNKMPKSAKKLRLNLDGLEAALPDARGLICIDEDIPAAGSVANGAFRWADAPEGWKRSVRELAVVLADDWPRLGLSR